ncbi:14960_t:CDS:1, partial [Gigaspora margarita]
TQYKLTTPDQRRLKNGDTNDAPNAIALMVAPKAMTTKLRKK